MLGLAFEHEDTRGSNLLVQQDLALGCNTDPHFCLVFCRAVVGRGQKRTEELNMGFMIWLRKVFSFEPPVQLPESKEASKPQMNEGDFHSGPEGYSAGTAYPGTFYASGGSSDGGHDEGDFNR